MNNKVSDSGLGSFSTVLFIVFLVLKLTSVIDWSWWWVTAPLWAGLALVLSIYFGALVFAAVWGSMPKKRGIKITDVKAKKKTKFETWLEQAEKAKVSK